MILGLFSLHNLYAPAGMELMETIPEGSENPELFQNEDQELQELMKEEKAQRLQQKLATNAHVQQPE